MTLGVHTLRLSMLLLLLLPLLTGRASLPPSTAADRLTELTGEGLNDSSAADAAEAAAWIATPRERAAPPRPS